MTYNPQNLKIEINASLGTKYLDNIMSHYPKLENIITCHNFYRSATAESAMSILKNAVRTLRI